MFFFLGQLFILSQHNGLNNMKYIDEYRNPEQVKQLAEAITRATTRPWNIMEVCGGQTHAIIRFGLDKLLPRPDYVDSRTGLPGMRHAGGDPGQGHCHCLAPRV